MVNFLPYSLLTAEQLNDAFASKADLQTFAPQTFAGQINAPIIQGGIAVSTIDLTATGIVRFSTTDAMTIPIGTTLQRPLPVHFGMFRANQDTGGYEVVGQDGSWQQINTTPAPAAPATPPSNLAGVTFGAPTASSIPVRWTAPTVGTRPFLYTLQYRLSNTTNWINWLIDATDSTVTATVSGLLDSTRYDFRVLARNTSGSTTSPVTSSATAGFAAGGPASLNASSPTSTTVFLAWSAVATSPVAYQVRYAPVGSPTFQNFAGPTSDTSMTVSGLAPNTLYNFQVQAKNINNSFESTVVQFSTAGAAAFAPSAPTALTASNATINSITLNWNPPVTGDPAFAYQVEYQVAGATGWTPFKTPTVETSMNVFGLTSATNYVFHVIAINSAGMSTSGTASGATLSATPVLGGVAEYQATPGLPTLFGPILASVAPGAALDDMGIGLDDPPAAYLQGSMILTVTCGSGTLTMTVNGAPLAGSGTSTIAPYATTLGGALNALVSLVYTANQTAGSDAIRITVTDQLTLQSSITINVNTTSGSPVPTPVPSPSPTPSGVGVQARKLSDLTKMIVLGTRMEHPLYNAGYTLIQAAVIENQINFVGNGGTLQFVRELCAGNMNASWLAQISFNCALFYYILAGDAVVPAVYGVVLNDMASLANITVFVQGFEGFDPGTNDVNLAAAMGIQASVDSLATLNDLQSYQMAPNVDTDYTTVGSNADHADISVVKALNLPSCPNGAYAPINNVNGALAQKRLLSIQANPGSANSEFVVGYQTFPDGAPSVPLPGWVAESVQAKYLIEAILDGFNFGAYNVVVHELMDADQKYGLFRNDGTPKLSAIALRFFMELMADSGGPFTPGLLDFSITSSAVPFGSFVNTGLRTLLLQASTGGFFLWIWNEQPLNDPTTNATITPANVATTLTFNSGPVQAVYLYDIFTQTSSTTLLSYANYTQPTQISMSLPPYPICAVIFP